MNWNESFTTQSIPHETKNDFFQVVPPTPFDFGTQHFPQSHQNHDDVDTHHPHTHHLRPTSVRSHHSASHASISSSFSGFSNGTQWGSESDYADPSQSQEFQEFHVDPRLFQAPIKTTTSEDETPVVAIAAPAAEKKKTKKARTAEEKAERKKVSHARKQHPEHIPRPRNAFILFRKHVVDSKLIPTSVEIRHQNVSIITAKMWAEKIHFNELAKIEKEEHLKKYPGYRYQPVYRRTNVIRRRVRKDQAEEEKCNNVAQLLMEGKTGEELADEIREAGSSTTPSTKKTATPKGVRAPSKKGQANELSKGALRALRAQSRQTGEWSDASRSVSRAVSPELELDDFESPSLDMAYLPGPGPVLVPDLYAQPQPSWGYQQPLQQSYIPDQTLDGTYTHQQPAFYNYDQALPFSPTTSTAFPTHAQPGVYGLRQGVQDMVFSAFPEGIQSPTGQSIPGPFSARWDGQFDNLLDINTNRGLMDGIPSGAYGASMDFEGQDMMLHDFGAALAQADDMGAW